MEASHARSPHGWGTCRSEARGWKADSADHEELRAAEAWTDGRYAEDGKHVELDYELAVAPGQRDRRRSKSHGPEDHSNGAKSRVRGVASIGRRLCAQVVERPGDSAAAETSDTQGCKEAKEVKEGLTTWSLTVAEYEHQFKAIDDAHKTYS